MEEIRHIGIDCGETEHRLVLLSPEGQFQASRSVSNEHDAIERGLRRLRRLLATTEGLQVRVVLEGLYGFAAPVVEVARDLGLEVWQVNSKALHHYRDLEGQPRKDDERDAFLLARMSYGNMQGCRLAIAPQPEDQRLRRFSRLHTYLTRRRGDVQRRLRSRLVELFPEIVQKAWEGPKWSSRALLAILRRWPGFVGLDKARKPTIERVLRQTGTGPDDRPLQAQALKTMAARLPHSLEREAITLELACLVAQLDTLDKPLKEVDQRMEALAQAHPVGRKLLDAAGVGPFTAAALVGEVYPLAGPLSEPQVATYAGLTPLSRKSGQKGKDGQKGKSVLARGVNKHALNACYMSALAAQKVSALDRAYYQKQHCLHQGHPVPHIVANLALARQRMKMLYKLMTTDAVYDKEVLIASHLRRFSTDCGKLSPSPPPDPHLTPG